MVSVRSTEYGSKSGDHLQTPLHFMTDERRTHPETYLRYQWMTRRTHTDEQVLSLVHHPASARVLQAAQSSVASK